MGSESYRIPLETAHQFLATFGITRPTDAYRRWVKEDGFDLKDFDSVLFESPFVFVIDWRCWLQEELETIAEALSRLDVELQMELDEDGETGVVSSTSGRSAAVSYCPADEETNFDEVIRAVQSVVPPNLEFRADPNNHGSDTSIYAVLPCEEWEELERLDPRLLSHFFEPLEARR